MRRLHERLNANRQSGFVTHWLALRQSHSHIARQSRHRTWRQVITVQSGQVDSLTARAINMSTMPTFALQKKRHRVVPDCHSVGCFHRKHANLPRCIVQILRRLRALRNVDPPFAPRHVEPCCRRAVRPTSHTLQPTSQRSCLWALCVSSGGLLQGGRLGPRTTFVLSAGVAPRSWICRQSTARRRRNRPWPERSREDASSPRTVFCRRNVAADH